MDNLLEIKNLAIGYGKCPVLENISVDLEKGKFISLLGANGSGKSTLLKTIGGSLLPLSGDILLQGKSITVLDGYEKARKIAIVNTFQDLAPDLSVKDILKAGRIPYQKWYQTTQSHDQQKIEEAIEELQLSGILTRLFNSLSDGQKQRVMIGRALTQDTGLILMDEPTAHLDIENKYKIFNLLQRLCHEKKLTVICSSHELELCLKYSHAIWLIDKSSSFNCLQPNETSSHAILESLFTNGANFSM